jgi:hypothetical protein
MRPENHGPSSFETPAFGGLLRLRVKKRKKT